MTIVVEKVSSAKELEKVFAIRKQVFVVEQHCPPELEWENEEVSVHFLATFNGKHAGACRWRKTDLGYKLERFSVLQEFRGKGIAQEMIKTVLEDLPAEANNIYLNAQITAIDLYKKFNFIPQGEQFEEAGILHYKMVQSK